MTLKADFTKTIDRALTDPAWDAYDHTIQVEVKAYTARFNVTPDWKLFKAQIWTESGAANAAWLTRPMQIGNPGDHAYEVLKGHKENTPIIMSPALMALFKTKSINDPTFNIQAGMAYAYTKLANFGTVITDKTIKECEVQGGDSLTTIAARVGTTIENLVTLNPKSKVTIFPKEKLKYQPAKTGVIGFKTFTPDNLQTYYNGNGDTTYAEKIKYCQGVIAKLTRTK